MPSNDSTKLSTRTNQNADVASSSRKQYRMTIPSTSAARKPTTAAAPGRGCSLAAPKPMTTAPTTTSTACHSRTARMLTSSCASTGLAST